jgi:general secretion pathway protein C
MTPREVRFAIDGVTSLVIVSVAAAAAILTWRVLGSSYTVSPVSTGLAGYSALGPAPDLLPISNVPPFGRPVVMTEAPESLSKLVLRGIVLSDPAWASTALIEGEGGVGAAFKVGELLPGGARLERIDSDYAVLRIGSQLVPLYFPEDERAKRPLVAGSSDPGAGVAADAPGDTSGRDAIRALLAPGVRGAESGNTSSAPPAAPSRGTSTFIDNLDATATPQGYKLGQNMSPQGRQFGLAPGDVVATVNGIGATRFANDPDAIARATATGQAQLVVLRGGNKITVTVPVR